MNPFAPVPEFGEVDIPVLPDGAKYQIVNITPSVRRVRLADRFQLSPHTSAMILSIALQPAPTYRPPGENDRWGWRSDLEYRWGLAKVYVGETFAASFDMLALMDGYYRATQADEALRYTAIQGTLDYINDRCREDPKAWGALEGAIEGANMQLQRYLHELRRVGAVSPSAAIPDGGYFSIHQYNTDHMLPSTETRVDKDRDLVFEVYLLEKRPV